MSTTGEKIKYLRTNHNLTQKQLASICHIARTTLAGYESDVISPQLDVLTILSSYFNVTLDFLAGLSNCQSEKVLTLDKNKFIKLPLLNIENSTVIKTIVVPIEKVSSGNKFFFTYAPCSLFDYRINSGDLLYIENNPIIQNGDIVLFKYNDKFFIAKYFKHYQIILYNKIFDNGFLCLAKNDLSILGIVLSVSFSLK